MVINDKKMKYMIIKPKRIEIPPKMIGLRMVRPARLKSKVHKSNVRNLRKHSKKSQRGKILFFTYPSVSEGWRRTNVLRFAFAARKLGR